MRKKPTFKYERELIDRGYRCVVGVDEAGCGALAGPVVAGACVLPLDSKIGRLHDSKLLPKILREAIYFKIIAKAKSWSVGIVSVKEIMQMGIRAATLLAMKRAVEGIDDADYCLVDAWTIPDIGIDQRGIVEGDAKIKSISAASVIAKVTRDNMMKEYAKKHPQYGFEIHKGYGTRQHRHAIKEFGPCAIHRLTFKTFEDYARR